MPDTGVNLRDFVPGLWKKLQGKGIGAVLARGAGGSFAVMVLGAAMAFGTSILLTRLLGVTQYGIYIYALTWINLLALVCQLGMNTSLLRFVAAYKANGEWGLLRGLHDRSIQYVLLASFIIGVTTAFVVWLLHDRIGADQAKTFWIALLLLPLIALTGLRRAGLRAFRRVVKAELPDSFFRPLLIAVLASGFIILSQKHLQATQVMVFNLIGALTAFFIGTVWLTKAMPEQLRHNPPVYAGREWLRVSLPLFFMSGMSLILNKTDIIMVGVILDSEQAGIYAVASRVAGLVVFGLTAANAIAAPMISELYSTERYQELQRMITLAARGIGAFTLVVSISLVILGQYMLGLFGEDFVIGYLPLLILLGGQAINALAGSVGFLMTMTGHQKQAAKIFGTSAILNIVANAFLIPTLGLIGAAIATAVTTALWNFMMLAYVWRRLNINPTVLARIYYSER